MDAKTVVKGIEISNSIHVYDKTLEPEPPPSCKKED